MTYLEHLDILWQICRNQGDQVGMRELERVFVEQSGKIEKKKLKIELAIEARERGENERRSDRS